jgi:cell division protein FtsQ
MAKANAYRKKKSTGPSSRKKKSTGPSSVGLIARALAALVWGLGIVILLLGISLILVAGYRWVTTTQLLVLQQVQVHGLHRLTRREVVAQAGLDRFHNLLDLSLWRVGQDLVDHPWIKSVAVYRNFPNGLRIEVEEEVPFFWRQQGERVFYADVHGEIIAPVEITSFTSLPLLVCNPDQRRDQRDLAIVTNGWSQNTFPFGLSEVAWIRFADNNRVQMMVSRQELEVVLGRSDLQRNMEALCRVWQDLLQRNEMEKTAYIYIFNGIGWVGYRSKVV